jgi:hypothetical protein
VVICRRLQPRKTSAKKRCPAAHRAGLFPFMDPMMQIAAVHNMMMRRMMMRRSPGGDAVWRCRVHAM